MSLIADALKTAQRQKQMRESSRPSGSPLIVPLKPQAPSIINRWRHVSIGVSSAVIVVSLVVLVQRIRPQPLEPVLQVPSPLAGTPLLSESPPQASAPRPAASGQAAAAVASAGSRPSNRIDSVGPGLAPRREQAMAAASPQPRGRAANRDSVVAVAPVTRMQEPAPPGGDAAPAAPQGIPAQATPPGRLRIAVERPANADAAQLFAEALAAHRAGNLAVARPLYERVLTLTPNDADALNNLGVLLSAQKDLDGALELLRRAATVAPRNAGTWNNIGAALREQGRNTEATAAFRSALAIDPMHQGAKVGLAQQYLTSGSPALARGLLEEVLVASPGLAEAHYALGQVLEQQGDRSGAIREFQSFIRLAPARLAEHVERVRRHVDDLGGAR